MEHSAAVNDFARRRLRQLRERRGLTMRDMAERLGIPKSTYASHEKGDARLHLDLLHKTLSVLQAEIEDVWPGPVSTLNSDSPYFWQTQYLRLTELCALSGSDSAALFLHRDGQSCALLSYGLTSLRIRRLCRLIGRSQGPVGGYWRTTSVDGNTYLLFINTEELENDIASLACRYLRIWSEVLLVQEFSADQHSAAKSENYRQSASVRPFRTRRCPPYAESGRS